VLKGNTGIYKKVTVLSSGLLPEILDLEKFARARRSSKRVISLARHSFENSPKAFSLIPLTGTRQIAEAKTNAFLAVIFHISFHV